MPRWYNRVVIQVAQLWQRDRANLATFWINVQSQNCIFELPHGGIRGNVSALSERFNAKNFIAELYQKNIGFISETAK